MATTKRGLVSYKEIIHAHFVFICNNRIDDNHHVNINATFHEITDMILENADDYYNFINYNINIIDKKNITYTYYKALYCYSIKNYDSMMYLLKEKHNEHCYVLMGNYYRFIVKNYHMMKEWYDAAIILGRRFTRGSVIGNYMLANFYFDIDDKYIPLNLKYKNKNNRDDIYVYTRYDIALPMYMDIKKKMINARYIMALYYFEHENNRLTTFAKTIKYLKKAIEYNHIESMFILAEIYNSLYKISFEFNYEYNAHKYYKMAAMKNHKLAAQYLAKQFYACLSTMEPMKQWFSTYEDAHGIENKIYYYTYDIYGKAHKHEYNMYEKHRFWGRKMELRNQTQEARELHLSRHIYPILNT